MPEESVEQLIVHEASLRFFPSFLKDHPEARLYMVGGAVRDAILGRKTKDFDFVIAGVPAKDLERWFAKHGSMDLTGRNFGVYKFLPHGSLEKTFVDIALPRTEQATEGSLGGYKDFETQSDAQLDITTDLARRDFTINAMAYDVRGMRLVDPYGGLEDLKSKTIRAVGDAARRFREDLSRILRAIRFASELAFFIEPHTWEALRKTVPLLNITRARADGVTQFVVPRETIGKELAKALAANPQRTLEMLRTSGIFSFVLPEVQQSLERDRNFLAPILSYEDGPLPVTLTLLLRDTDPSRIGHILQRVGLTSLPLFSPLRVEAEDIAWLVRTLKSDEALHADSIRASQFERLFMTPRGTFLKEALRRLEKHSLLDTIKQREEKIWDHWQLDEEKRIPNLVSGSDVLDVGVAPGPRVRELLSRVRDAQLEGRIKTHAEALRLLSQLVKE